MIRWPPKNTNGRCTRWCPVPSISHYGRPATFPWPNSPLWSIRPSRHSWRRLVRSGLNEEDALMRQRNAVLVHGNALKLGLFGANCASGRTYAILAERWEASWENNVKLAQLADAVGIECMVPIARWKGYGGASNPNGSSFESIAWACGLLAVTRRLNVFCT